MRSLERLCPKKKPQQRRQRNKRLQRIRLFRAEVLAEGSGEGLEQTLRALRWLRHSGLLQGPVAVRDNGLDREGLELAMALARREGAEFLGRRPE